RARPCQALRSTANAPAGQSWVRESKSFENISFLRCGRSVARTAGCTLREQLPFDYFGSA
ncbi:MAG: hypothetical protein ACI89X_004707, partial [Planctomycetota bacterium]